MQTTSLRSEGKHKEKKETRRGNPGSLEGLVKVIGEKSQTSVKAIWGEEESR